MNISTIQSAYTLMWRVFSDAVEEQGLIARSHDDIGALVRRKDDRVVAEAFLFMRNWPYKSVSDRRKIDIAVWVEEVFSEDCARIVKATTRVGYFKREQSVERPLLELHYDFETPCQEAHPFFHAQIGSSNWPMDKFRGLGSEDVIERENAEAGYGNARIPTAFMGYASILVSLAADHLKPQSFRKMVAELRNPRDGVLHPECSRLAGYLAPSAVPLGHHWYDERYVVHEWEVKAGKRYRASVPVLRIEVEGKTPTAARSAVMTRLNASRDQLEFRVGEPRKVTS